MTGSESTAHPSNAEGKADSPTFISGNGRDGPTVPNGAMNASGSGEAQAREERMGQPRNPPPGQEKLTITTNTAGRKKDWARQGSPSTEQRGDRLVFPAMAPYSRENPHKRKRSGSIDANPQRPNSIHSQIMPDPTKQTPTTASTVTDGQRDDNLQGPAVMQAREPYSADVRYGQYFHDDRDPASAHDLSSAQQYSAISQTTNPDDRLREALAQNMEPQSAYERDQDTPNSEDRSGHPYSSSGIERREVSVQSDPKKRKRNFSNRTKTGCMTCRRRKKKCDESQPECNNCLRGGFVCSGYQTRGLWPKPESKQAPIPLQSKDGYEAAGYGASSPYETSPVANTRREPLPGHRGQVLRVDPQLRKPDNAPMSSTSATSPENNRLSAVSFSHQTPTPISATSSVYAERHANTQFGRMDPMHEPSRPDPRAEIDTPQSAKSSMNHILHPQLQSESPRAAQVAAQLALSHPASANTRPKTQKEEMLAGHHYFPFDKELVLERERCNGACWRFNSSTNPNNGVSPEERARLFRDILQPREQVVSPTQASVVTPMGRVGNNVVVEAPFTCDYGYNITIGQDVAIGKNCTILDTCEVKIDDRCNIGPNVSIYTASLPIDPKRRLGSCGPSIGSQITIEADCWIGGGVTILPGRTIHKGSVVGAGSVVTRDVPPYTIACGNPARVQGAVYREG